ncbi:MAG: PQQ-binding-like beta-propeller repeat protein [Anaerolineales bacterium]|nr:PQQ-binding-like beta-propeller repeat protein [Anaerolineales bacterium]
MKVKTILVIVTVMMLSVLLSGCSAAALRSNSWSGLSADAEKAYLANGSFVYAVNLSNGSQAWRYPVEKADSKESYFAAPVLTAGDQLLIASAGANHSLVSLDPNTGIAKWTFGEAEGGWVASPLVVTDTIYAANTDGALYALDLNGNLLWKTAIGGKFWSRPVTDGKLLYITSLDHDLYAVDLNSHEVVWQKNLGGAVPGAPVLDAGTLYAGTFGSEMIAIDAASQNNTWAANTHGWVWDAAVLEESTLYFGDLEGFFYALDTADGSTRWDPIQPDGPIIGTPLVTTDFIVIGTESGTAYAVDRDGKIVWNQNIGGRLYSAPVQGGDMLLLSPMETDYVLVALDFDGKQVWAFTPTK